MRNNYKPKYETDHRPWDGNLGKIPPINVLVAIDTASEGLQNALVKDYVITWHRGKPQIRIFVEYVEGPKNVGNERMLEDLHHPLTLREQRLIKELGKKVHD